MYREAAEQEQRIARKVLRAILAAGYSVRVWDGEAYAGGITAKEAVAWEAMGSSDQDQLAVLDTTGDNPRRVGSILLIWGNGEDLVSDYSWNVNYEGSEAIIGKLAEA